MYRKNKTLKQRGILSVAIPGQVAGLYKLWEKHGSKRLNWSELVKPAARLAKQGSQVSRFLHFQMTKSEKEILADEGLSSIFAKDGKILKVNDIVRNRKLGETLEKISTINSSFNGVYEFYNGSIARDLIKDIHQRKGIITLKDLSKYEVKFREPIIVDTLGHTVIGMPPPSSGAASMMLVSLIYVLVLCMLNYIKKSTNIRFSMAQPN